MLRRQKQVIRLSAPTDTVFATTAVGRGGYWIAKGTPVQRDHPFVRELPSAFEVRYQLDQERSEELNENG
jgi:hypothetical protein